MSTDIMLSLDALPVELLYRIFDSLDAETILLSVQYVCKRFHSVTNNYNRYELNFKSIFKHKFHQICHTSHPKNVTSLILSDENQTPGQTGLFLSLYHIEEYTRLKSVTLLSIEESYLKIILEHLSTKCALTSLIMQCVLTYVLSTETLMFLSSIIGKPSLRKLDLTFAYGTINKLEWPIECSIQYLRIYTGVQLDKFCTILRSSPHLKTMILRDCIIEDIDEFNHVTSNISHRQLISFTLEDCELKMKMIELLLSLTPSLVNFTLIGNNDELFDGARWEQFIQTKLPNLSRFQFDFQSNLNFSHDLSGLESLIAPFRTVFWTETKQWFVTALCIEGLPMINLSTIRYCAPRINFRPKANKTLCSTIPVTMKDLITMTSVRELTLNLVEMQADMTEEEEIRIHRLFNKLTKLILRLDGDWPNGSLKLLSSLIDLSTIIELVLDANFTESDSFNTTVGIGALLKQTSNIRSLIISRWTALVQTICLIVTNSVQDLQVAVNSVEDAQMILTQFDHLSSVTFQFQRSSLGAIDEIIEWLVSNNKDFTYQSTKRSLSLWLGKNTKELFKIDVDSN